MYTNVEPVSWWIKGHINEGRDELNFSEWKTYSPKRSSHKLEEIIELVEDHEMPLDSYTWAHSEARLSEKQRDQLIKWVQELRKRSI